MEAADVPPHGGGELLEALLEQRSIVDPDHDTKGSQSFSRFRIRIIGSDPNPNENDMQETQNFQIIKRKFLVYLHFH